MTILFNNSINEIFHSPDLVATKLLSFYITEPKISIAQIEKLSSKHHIFKHQATSSISEFIDRNPNHYMIGNLEIIKNNTLLVFFFTSPKHKENRYLPYFKNGVKSAHIPIFSGPYFPACRLNTERCSISFLIQSECG